MKEELMSIEKNNTWSLVNLPQGNKVIGVKWIFRSKFDENGNLDKYKAKLVAKGYSQQFGIDYQEVFAPVARIETVRTIVAQDVQLEWRIHQLDVKSAFLRGDILEEIYVEQSQGFVVKGSEDKVYKLQRPFTV
ncbi:unnamed protein product [Rhodiola kirilowii]